MRYIIALLMTSTAAFAEVPKVVTDIQPVQSLAAAVMEGLGSPEVLLDRGASPHSFQMRPSQAAAVAGADLVIWIGPELTPWMDAAVDGRPQGAALLGLLAAEGTHRRHFAEAEDEHEEAGHDHVEEHADDHPEEHAEDEHDHPHSGTDPHAWLDPENGKLWLGLIAAELSRLDPENAATYAANADKAAAAIDAADARAKALLDPVKALPFVAFHDAYGYFAEHYGLDVEGTVALGDAASPGARHLTELRATMQAGQTLCIFPEIQHDPALVDQMAEATGARVGGALDPEGSTLEPGPGLYPALITGLAGTLAACLAP
jgi:zinc transport system substrate-binding protein